MSFSMRLRKGPLEGPEAGRAAGECTREGAATVNRPPPLFKEALLLIIIIIIIIIMIIIITVDRPPPLFKDAVSFCSMSA